ncbi:Rpn family recombination-promoting nuclease/putative transposase [Limosilactobacillus sp. STM2_1]|uniref:Rpn family recombination-promoting nuclease/putative transposase n=1 Tax=Limosilactobacillus rudii TaxID=2759755 RepID=A0A7W3UM71_9LACO|nr:Rpn family recombination-promoting nuclease/putative transposase [Limosilactobacillus rudii]MBB1080025.1 Rpn family recombination-promoting nuclease/putative transposase [Limosilactobacillus rudii]MBB1098158.1 Rpn family recombination-promoting nuclease/putative transposase [Limosilactobacillus rudii]MCD7135230.1 Rpn family recombination-promoting nuclease/putative transposase [Limosilactobacillus rudii]
MNNELTLRKRWENADLTDDYIFNKVMLDKDICLELLRRILPTLNIKDIQFPNNQQELAPAPDAKAVRFDIYTTDEHNNHYDIEMQVVNKHNLAKRIRYYQAASTMESYDKGKSYDTADDSYVIFFCNFDPFNLGFQRYTLHKHIDNAPEHIVCDGQSDILFNIPSTKHEVDTKMQAVLDIIAQRKVETPDNLVVKLRERMEKVKQNRKWRAEYMRLSMYEMDQQIREEKMKKQREEIMQLEKEIEKQREETMQQKAEMEKQRDEIEKQKEAMEKQKEQMAKGQAELTKEQGKLVASWNNLKESQENAIHNFIKGLQDAGIDNNSIKKSVKSSFNLDDKQVEKYLN